MNTREVRRRENHSYENRSGAFAAIHEMMEGLHEVGAIDKQTMREFDEVWLKANGDTCFP
jgi:DNA-binding transcriptional regulator YiaG